VQEIDIGKSVMLT